MILRDYQTDAVNSVFDYFSGGGVAPLIVTPTGSGKSVILAAIIHQFCRDNPGGRVLVITHVKELVEQDAGKIIDLWPEAPMGIYSAGMKRREIDQITVASIQSIYRRGEFFGAFDLIIVDECFVAGTKISTPKGLIDIDQLRCGDLVYTASGVGSIDSISIRPAEEIYTVEFEDGTKCECTKNHPFFTDKGWVKAGAMEIGASVFSAKGVRFLWESFSSMDEKNRNKDGDEIGSDARKIMGNAEMLLSILCKEIKEPDEQSCRQTQNENDFEKNSSSTYKKRREWALAAFAAASPSACFGGRLGSGISNPNWDEGVGVSDLLQNGYSQSIKNDCYRGGRPKPHVFGKEEPRQEKSRISYFKRVVNISCIKRKSSIPVFNLHVNGHPSYFANGVLVHNCHLIPQNQTGMYSSFLIESAKINTGTRLIGLTATPYRLQSGMLHEGEGAMFDGISYEASIADLINQGYLSRLTCKHGADVDLSGVGKTGGEFNLGDLGGTMAAMELVNEHCDAIVERCQGRRAILVFAVTVAHAEAVRDALVARGIASGIVSGDMATKDRDAVIGAFKAGELRALVNCQVLTTGFDYPAIDAVVMLRPTLSPGLYVQMAGRGLRLAPGKTDCLIVDFGGNVMRHGFIDAVRPPRKGAGAGQAPVKRCPECSGLIPLGAKVCPQCEYVFPVPEAQRKSNAVAYDGPMMSTEMPVMRMKVSKVGYARHVSKSGLPVLRVSYYAGLRKLDEYVCLEHLGFARTKADHWWRRRNPGDVPPGSVEAALERTDTLKVPHYILVNYAQKYPEIVKYEF